MKRIIAASVGAIFAIALCTRVTTNTAEATDQYTNGGNTNTATLTVTGSALVSGSATVTGELAANGSAVLGSAVSFTDTTAGQEASFSNGPTGINNYAGSHYENFEDNVEFLQASTGWQVGIWAGLCSGCTWANSNSTTRPGLWSETSTTGAAVARMITATGLLDLTVMSSQFYVTAGWSAVSTGTNTYAANIGYFVTSSSIVTSSTNAIAFLYDEGNVSGWNSGNTNNLICYACNAGTGCTHYLIAGTGNSDESFALGSAAVAAYTKPSTNMLGLLVKVTTAAGSITRAEYYVNSGGGTTAGLTKVCDINTHLPPSGGNVQPIILNIASAGTSQPTMYLDQETLSWDLTTPRGSTTTP